jgi:hypothetical protein
MAAPNANRGTIVKRLICVAAAAALLTAGSALAGERAVARLIGISGNILVSNEQTIASASEALRLTPGMRVLATLNSRATIEYADGCRVHLNAGDRIEVSAQRPCATREMKPLALAPVLGGQR